MSRAKQDQSAALAASIASQARVKQENDKADVLDAQRWRAMRQTLVAVDFAPDMGGGAVALFECHATEVFAGPEGADAIADAAIAKATGETQ